MLQHMLFKILVFLVILGNSGQLLGQTRANDTASLQAGISDTATKDSPSSRPDAGVSSLKTRTAFYPQVMALGDVGYFVIFEKNNGIQPLDVFSAPKSEIAHYIHFRTTTITSPDVGGRYIAASELENQKLFTKKIIRGGSVELAPGDERMQACVALEFPPLEDWNDPFWTAVRKKLTTSSNVELRLNVEYYCSTDGLSYKLCQPHKIVIHLNQREQNEFQLLTQWFDATPSRFFPVRFTNGSGGGFVKAPSSNTLRKIPTSGQSDIIIGGKSYDPWLFVRIGNRKPSDPNNPTTVDGWRELEAEFAPSTLRDEITLTRLQLEYYDAEEGEASDAALKALVDWTSQRPEPQRVVLSQSLLSKRGKFKGTPLEAKNATLGAALASAFPGETSKSDDAK